MESDSAPLTCVSCGAPLRGRYCAHCGERRVEPHEHAISHFATDALRDASSVYAKLFRTVRILAARPGQLIREFMIGRRKPYLRPLQPFLIANLFYFFMQPVTTYTGYNTPLRSQMDQQSYSRPAGIRRVVEKESPGAERRTRRIARFSMRNPRSTPSRWPC